MKLSRRCRRLSAGLLILFILLWFARAPILRTAAHLWIVDEPAIPSRAIIVLGGGEDYRPFAAARLWKQGLAPVILVPNVQPSPTETLGLRPPTTQVILGVLKSEGVPDSAIQRIGSNVTSTREEALAVKTWLEINSSTALPHTLLIPTDPLATRRTNAFFEKTLPGYDIRVLRADPGGLDVDTWWSQESGLIAFQNEVIKWLYYKVKY